VPGLELVLITASVEHAAVSGALEAGFSGLVPKEASGDELLAAVRAAAKGEVRFSPDVLNMLIKARRAEAMTPSVELSSRELEVLDLVANGRATGEIAAQLFLSQHTVRNHVRNILGKLEAHSKLEAVVIAARQGLIRLGDA
jgi:two-component system NarL family response regulator